MTKYAAYKAIRQVWGLELAASATLQYINGCIVGGTFDAMAATLKQKG